MLNYSAESVGHIQQKVIRYDAASETITLEVLSESLRKVNLPPVIYNGSLNQYCVAPNYLFDPT